VPGPRGRVTRSRSRAGARIASSHRVPGQLRPDPQTQMGAPGRR
jgi:hypothetical protein